MATVHFGRLSGPAGFARAVAIKRLHPQLAREPEFVSMFLDEVRLAARIHHPNVVATLDAVEDDGELFLVMEYVYGESLAQLVRLARSRGEFVPPGIASTIMCGLLHGLHAAHEAMSEDGQPLGIIHRDVSPQNVLVGADGVTRVLDFGIARAAGRLQITREGQLKGKIAYLAPERVHGRDADRRSDIYGAAVVLWEALTGVQLFEGDSDVAVLAQVVSRPVDPPSSIAPDISEALDAITLRGLDRDPENRFSTAREMAIALQQHVGVVAPSEVGDWVSWIAADRLAQQARSLAQFERFGISESSPPSPLDNKEPGATRIRVEPSTRVLPPSPPHSALPHCPPQPAEEPSIALAGAMEAEREGDSAGASLRSVGVDSAQTSRRFRLAGMLVMPLAAILALAALAVLWPRSHASETNSRTVVPAAATIATLPAASATRSVTGDHDSQATTAASATAPSATAPNGWVAPGLPASAQPSTAIPGLPASAQPTAMSPRQPTSTSAGPYQGDSHSGNDRPRVRHSVLRGVSNANANANANAKASASGKPADSAHAPPLAEPEPLPTHPSRNPCRPPYTIDSSGVKHFKVECIVDGRQ